MRLAAIMVSLLSKLRYENRLLLGQRRTCKNCKVTKGGERQTLDWLLREKLRGGHVDRERERDGMSE